MAASPDSWLSTLEAKEREIAKLFEKMESRQAELEKSQPAALNSIPITNSRDMERVKEDLTSALNEKLRLTEDLKVAKRNLETVQKKYTDEVTALGADMARAREEVAKSEADLDFIRSELDRVLLECEQWKSLATQNPIPEPGSEQNKDAVIANLKTELEIVNRAKTSLALQLDRKASMDKKCDELAKELEEQKAIIDNLNMELEIVNKTKTVLEFHKSLDDTIETGYNEMKAEVDVLRAELGIVTKTNETLTAQLQALQAEHDDLKDALDNQGSVFSKSIKDMTADCAQKVADISLLHDKLDAISREKDDLTAQIQSLYRDLEKERKAHDEGRFVHQTEMQAVNSSVNQKDYVIRALEEKVVALSNEKEALIAQITAFEEQIKALRDECNAKAGELTAIKYAEDEAKQKNSNQESTIAEELELTKAQLEATKEECKRLVLENKNFRNATDAKDITLKSLHDQLASQPLTKALEGTHDELLAALRREMERKNAYIEELTDKVIKLESCNNELVEGMKKGPGTRMVVPESTETRLLENQLQSKSQELNKTREEFEQSMRDTEQRYDDALHELEKQVESAKSFKEVAESLQVELEKREREFELQFQKLKQSQERSGVIPQVTSTMSPSTDEEVRQLKEKLDECQSTCDARLEAMAQEYEKKLEIFVQQLNDNLVDQEKELGEKLENQFNEKLRRECSDMEAEYQRKLDRLNNQWEKRLQMMPGVDKKNNGVREENRSTPEMSQIRILQTRVQELQNALNMTQMAAMEGDEKDEIYQGRIRELVARLAEMETEKTKLKQKIEGQNKAHSEEIQSYIQTVQSCFEQDPDLNKQVEQMRKIHRRELANVQTKLRLEYEAKFQELKSKFEEKLLQVKESMQRNGSSTGTVVTPRALSPITAIDDMNHFGAIFGEFLQDARGSGGEFPDGFCDKLAILKSRAEQLYLTMRRETLGALEVEQKRNRETEEEWEDKLNGMEERHQQELARLADDYNAHKREMEYASHAAMAAVQSGTSSLDVLKQQLIDKQKEIHQLRKKHKSELKQLRRMMDKSHKRQQQAGSGSEADEDEDAVKITYLRDILFQYMTGRNSRTLARMIAAVVNFTPEQTDQVVEHEARRRDGSRLRSPSAPRHTSPQKR